MVKERYNYSLLLDILRYAHDNYQINKEGNIINDYNVVEQNNCAIATVRFSYLYSLAYKSIGAMENTFIDYKTFNSFINICLNEYKIYSDIGTGKVLYFPCQGIADYIFMNDQYRNMLIDYLENVIINIKEGNDIKRKSL